MPRSVVSPSPPRRLRGGLVAVAAAVAAGVALARRRGAADDPTPTPETASPVGHVAADGSTMTTQPGAGGVSVTPHPSTTGDQA